VLGAIPPQYLEPEPVRVHRDVAAWLRAGCAGIVLLTRDGAAISRILSQVQRADYEDAAHAAELSRILQERTPAPARAARPFDRRRLERLAHKVMTASELQREGKLRWACRVLGAAAGNREIRPELARALLVRAGVRAGLAETAAQRLVAASFHEMGGLNEGERRWSRPI
jgi:hypothetical protein